MESIGRVLKEFRKEHRMTQKDLSQDICSQSVLSRIENDEEIPNIIVMQQLCQRLGITIDQLMVDFLPEELLLRKYFHKMYQLLRAERYSEIDETLEYLDEQEFVFLDKDRQQFYFFRAVCCYYLECDPESALKLLRKGLELSISKKYHGYFDNKLLLLGFAAKMNEVLHNRNEAERFYCQGVDLFRTMMSGYSEKIELSQVFLNYASFLKKEQQYERAEHILDLGLRWNQHQQSYYKFSEMLALKIFLLQQQGKIEKVAKFQELLEASKKIQQFNLNGLHHS
ncbi:transcriptional regulator [Enterococcus florum]|uniref:Transcriptional regulator n=1 Tax=Enterococcus florum TaxID=2480627 RepID=A0A4P5PCA5_9ENTE|nr:helix-turn-helix transcriptional regulator [Enterococcus florum]GCF95426.1 transcriptional regulator [Enterococcus florum]